jgi:hypothetical protein
VQAANGIIPGWCSHAHLASSLFVHTHDLQARVQVSWHRYVDIALKPGKHYSNILLEALHCAHSHLHSQWLCHLSSVHLGNVFWSHVHDTFKVARMKRSHVVDILQMANCGLHVESSTDGAQNARAHACSLLQ